MKKIDKFAKKLAFNESLKDFEEVISQTAKILKIYYEQMLNQGFDNNQALYLTAKYQEILFNQSGTTT